MEKHSRIPFQTASPPGKSHLREISCIHSYELWCSLFQEHVLQHYISCNRPALVMQGYDPDKDVAVLKIEAPPEVLRPLAVGDSKSLKVGKVINNSAV